MKRHPEQADDEIFLGNHTDANYPQVGWQSKRWGNIAYMVNGAPLSERDARILKPLFIKRSEVEQKISGEGSPLYKNILQRMLDRGHILLVADGTPYER